MLFETSREGGSAPRMDGGLELRGEGDRLYLGLSAAQVRRTVLLARVALIGLAVAAAALAGVTPWAIAGSGLALVGVILTPALIRSEPLLCVERSTGQVIPLQPELAGQSIPGRGIQEVRGAYETQGWDARSVIRLILPDGSERPALILAGSDERRAEAACRLLAEQLDCPATYTGAMGKTKPLSRPTAAK